MSLLYRQALHLALVIAGLTSTLLQTACAVSPRSKRYIHLPPSCPHSDIQTFRLCNAMTRGKFALCNNPIACSRPRNSVAPDRFIENCVRDVCQSPPSERERSACVAYTAYAVACRESCHLQLDLTMFPGCEVPTIRLHPGVQSVWQGYPTSLQCVASSGYPTTPLDFSINGNDIDNMSNASVKCATTTNCSLLVHSAIARKDSGIISCCTNNVVGKDCKKAQLIVRAGSFSVSVSSSVLVGSRVYPQITKIPSDNPVDNVVLELTVSKRKVTELDPSVPTEGKYQWDVRQLPQGAQFGVLYRLRVWDRLTQYEGFSNTFTFARDTIDIDVPVDRHGRMVVPPLAYLGQTTWFTYNYSQTNVFMQQLTFSLVNLNGTFVDNVGTHSALPCRFPSLPSWVPGTSIGLGSDLYRLHASDGTTGADGTSEPFRITRGSVSLVVPSHITYGSIVSVFGKVEPPSLAHVFRYHVVQADDCHTEVADVTDDIQNWPHATWKLMSVLDLVSVGQQYRLQVTTPCPSYLQACSRNTITFNTGKIVVSIAKATDVVYVDETIDVTFHVPQQLAFVTRVSVKLHCYTLYGVLETWTLASAVPKDLCKVSWHVGHEGVSTPWHAVAPDLTCYVSVYDVGHTGATGRSHNVTVGKACVIADPAARTVVPMGIGVQFRANQDLSTVSVQFVNPSNTSNVLLDIPNSEITVGDNMLTIQRARVPDVNGQPTAGPFIVRVYYQQDGITGYSDPITFKGWSLEVKVVHTKGLVVKRPLLLTEVVNITFRIPKELLYDAGSIRYEMFLRNSTGNFSILSNDVLAVSVNCTADVGCSCTNTVAWLVGKVSTMISVGRYTVVVRDKPQQGGSFLIEGHSQEIDIIRPDINMSPEVEPNQHQPIEVQSESGKSLSGSRSQSSTDGGRLNPGVAAGIAVAVVVVVALFVLLVMIVARKGRHSGSREKLLPSLSREERGHVSHGYQSLNARLRQEEVKRVDGDSVSTLCE